MLLILARGQVHYAASDFLPSVLKNPDIGSSYDPTKTAFQQAAGTKLALFDWMHQMVPASNTNWRPVFTRRHPGEDKAYRSSVIPRHPSSKCIALVPRPEKSLFHLAMVGLGRGTEQYYAYDFPWKRLGSGTVVDVGGGIGKFTLELLHM
jgi:hypothetical protein